MKGGREGSQLPKVCHELARQNILEHKKSNDRKSEVRLAGVKKNLTKTLPIKMENGRVGEMAQQLRALTLQLQQPEFGFKHP